MCIEFQHLSCQVLAVKGLAYLLTYFIAVFTVAWKMTRNWKTRLTLAFAEQNYFRIFGLGLNTSGLVTIPAIRYSLDYVFLNITKLAFMKFGIVLFNFWTSLLSWTHSKIAINIVSNVWNNYASRSRSHFEGNMDLHIVPVRDIPKIILKTKLAAVSLCCKNYRNSNPQIF